jgi:hypothetical protein
MPRYGIDEEESTVSIEVVDVGGHQDQLLEAFEKCQSGQCACPTTEYGKLASMEVEQGEDLVRLRLEPKPGKRFDTSEIAACLEYTTAKVAHASTNG